MPIPGIDPTTFVVPANQLLIFQNGSVISGKKSSSELVEVNNNDMIRLDLSTDKLPCLVPLALYTSVHAMPPMENLDLNSAFAKTAGYKFSKLVKDQKASVADLTTTEYNIQTNISGATTTIANLRTAVEGTSGQNAVSVTGATGEPATKVISLILADNTLSQDENGLKTAVSMFKQATAEAGFAATYFLGDSEGNVIGEKINLIKDKFLKSASLYQASGSTPPSDWAGDAYIDGHKYIRFEWETTPATVFYLDITGLAITYTGVDAINVNNTNHTVSIKIKNSAVQTSDRSSTLLLTQTTEGLKVQGVQDGIDYKVGKEQTRATEAEATLQNNITAEATSRATEDAAIRSELEAGLNNKVTGIITNADTSKAIIFNEADGGGAKIERADGRWIFIGVNNADGLTAETNAGSIYNLKLVDGVWKGLRFVVMNDKITYVPNGVLADSNAADREIAVKADIHAKLDKVATGTEYQVIIANNDGSITASGKTLGGAYFEDIPQDTKMASELGVVNTLSAHANRTDVHEPIVSFIRAAETVEEMEYLQYVCKAQFIGTLPYNPPDGTKRIVSILYGGENSIINAAEGNKIDNGTSEGTQMLILTSVNKTTIFVFDSVTSKWCMV